MKRKIMGIGELPSAPLGDRVLVIRDQPQLESEGGIKIPENAGSKPNTGRLVHAGLQARDKMWDHGLEIGDSVVWGQFAGVYYQWDHLVKNGDPKCSHPEWSRMARPYEDASAFRCDTCSAERWVEPASLMNVDDIQTSVELEEKLRTGKFTIKRGKNADGATCHFIERHE